MNCPKCDSPMEKGTPLNSGNTKFETFRCDVCDHTEMRAR